MALYKLIKFETIKDYDLIQKENGYLVQDEHNNVAAALSVRNVQFLALLKFYKGIPKGGHYHKKKRETILAVDGDLECRLIAVDSSKSDRVIVRKNHAVVIEPGVAHIFYALNDEVSGIEWSSEVFDKDDIFQYSFG